MAHPLRAVAVSGAALLALAWLGSTLSKPGGALRTPPSPLPVLGQIEPFQLTNQVGQLVTASELRGKIWIADIIFTRCPGPCMRLSRLVQNLASHPQHRTNPAVAFVSLTADPSHDTPGVLAEYGRQFETDASRWFFLTGPQHALYRLATQSLKLAVMENPEPEKADPEDLFIHSTHVAVVDQIGRLRAVIESDQPTAEAQIADIIRSLLREEAVTL